MKVSKRILLLAMLIAVCIFLHFISRFTNLVETLYSNGFYQHYAAFLRAVFGWIPFSVGDILYGSLVIWFLWKLLARLLNRFNRNSLTVRRKRGSLIYKFAVILCLVYILFNISWGLNYNRRGIGSQLRLKMETYSVAELKELNCLLQTKVIASKKMLDLQNRAYPESPILFKKVMETYSVASVKYPFLKFKQTSMKSSMWGWLGNYMGFTGYYNPFTGEAQINTTVPKFLQPFIACHEAAHQAGYAKEQEANFVGYLAASVSPDTLFRYSVYLDMFVYANRNLSRSDSAAARLYVKDLGPSVLKDLDEWRDFNRRHRSWMEPVFRLMYGLFLRGNQQPEGLLSYDEVTGFLIAYYKKFRTV